MRHGSESSRVKAASMGEAALSQTKGIIFRSCFAPVTLSHFFKYEAILFVFVRGAVWRKPAELAFAVLCGERVYVPHNS